MKYYIDITLLPDAETNLGFLWHKIYQQIHIALAENQTKQGNSDIAISFIGYGSRQFPLGDQLRLLAANQQRLINLDVQTWLSRLTDCCHIKTMQQVPGKVERHARFSREPVKSLHKKAKRRADHLNKSLDEVMAFLVAEENFKEKSTSPFITLESQSTSNNNSKKHRFPLFIKKTLFDEPQNGTFDCYGLSKTATVPWF